MTRRAWFGCHAGASGDMFLGALVDAGAPLERDAGRGRRDRCRADPARGADVTRQGLAATKVDVHVAAQRRVRTWANIRGLLEQADLAEPVRARALGVFARLARAEAAAHRVSPEQVHFHEVGALDAVADVVGSCAGPARARRRPATASPVALGSGMVRGEHGLLPVPGARGAGAAVGGGGAGLLRRRAVRDVHADGRGAARRDRAGLGRPAADDGRPRSGSAPASRDLDEVPNVLRVVIGEPADAVRRAAPDGSLVVAANVDDLDPRLWPAVLGRLLDAGAADAWLTPILMKKGRPAHTLSVLTDDEHADAVRRVVFTESSTIGLREHRVGQARPGRGRSARSTSTGSRSA